MRKGIETVAQDVEKANHSLQLGACRCQWARNAAIEDFEGNLPPAVPVRIFVGLVLPIDDLDMVSSLCGK